MNVATQKDRREYLRYEVERRRERLDAVRLDLQNAVIRLRRSGDSAAGTNVTRLTEAARIAEIALDGAQDELRELSEPTRQGPVTATGLHAWKNDLLRSRAEILRLRTNRENERKLQEERVRQQYSGAPADHLKIYIDNHMGSAYAADARARAAEERRISAIDAELAELDQRRGQLQGGAA